MLNEMRTRCKTNASGIDFENAAALSDEDYYNLTGITKDQFSSLATSLTSLRYTSNRSVRTCLALLFNCFRDDTFVFNLEHTDTFVFNLEHTTEDIEGITCSKLN
jgi:hypothetical protein